MNRTLGSLKLWQAAIFFFVAPVVVGLVLNLAFGKKAETTA